MTAIVFDGTCLVADGLTSYRDPLKATLFNSQDTGKIRVLEKPWPLTGDEGCKTFITALAGTGGAKEISTVIAECTRAIRTGIPMEVFRDTYLELYGGIFPTIAVVGVGYTILETGNRKPFHTWVFTTEQVYQENWECPDSVFITAGIKIETLSRFSPHKTFSNGVEYINFVCAMQPDYCGGVITRYNTLTGKLDTPPVTKKTRLLKLVDELVKTETDTLAYRAKLAQDAIEEKFK